MPRRAEATLSTGTASRGHTLHSGDCPPATRGGGGGGSGSAQGVGDAVVGRSPRVPGSAARACGRGRGGPSRWPGRARPGGAACARRGPAGRRRSTRRASSSSAASLAGCDLDDGWRMRAASVGCPMFRNRSARRNAKCRSGALGDVRTTDAGASVLARRRGRRECGNAHPGLGLVRAYHQLARPAAFWSVAVLLVLVLAARGCPRRCTASTRRGSDSAPAR